MNKKLIKLTENDLKQIVKKSVSKLLKENYENPLNNKVRLLDGVNAVTAEVTNKFKLDEYGLTIHGSFQNNKAIIFQLDNTGMMARVNKSFPYDWKEFQIIAKHIYDYLKSIGIKMICKPSLIKKRGYWGDKEMFAFMYAEMYIPNEYIEKGAEKRRLGKTARIEKEKRITKPSQEVQKQIGSMRDRQFDKRTDINDK